MFDHRKLLEKSIEHVQYMRKLCKRDMDKFFFKSDMWLCFACLAVFLAIALSPAFWSSTVICMIIGGFCIAEGNRNKEWMEHTQRTEARLKKQLEEVK